MGKEDRNKLKEKRKDYKYQYKEERDHTKRTNSEEINSKEMRDRRM